MKKMRKIKKVSKYCIVENDLSSDVAVKKEIAKFSDAHEARDYLKYMAKHPRSFSCVYTLKKEMEG